MSDRPWHVLSAGPFGAAVADRLAAQRPVVRTRLEEPGAEATAHWPVAPLRVLCAWRAVPRVERLLDEAAFAWRVPWLPVVLEHPELRVGPFVVPGTGPCHACFRRRAAQHSSSADVTAELHERLDADPTLGAAGFMPFHVTIAAALAQRAISAREAGRVRRVNVVTLQPTSGRVVGVHGCRQCGSGVPEATRSHAALERELGALLGEAVA